MNVDASRISAPRSVLWRIQANPRSARLPESLGFTETKADDRYHMLCFLNVAKEVTGQSFRTKSLCDNIQLNNLMHWIIFYSAFYSRKYKAI